jgi:hypothetical protein
MPVCRTKQDHQFCPGAPILLSPADGRNSKITNAGVGPPIQPQQIVPDRDPAQAGKWLNNRSTWRKRETLRGCTTPRRVDNPDVRKTQVGTPADQNILLWISPADLPRCGRTGRRLA